MDETSQLKTKTAASSSRVKAKKRDRSASEERLLAAGEEIFSQHGFKGATTRMIAKKAKINESLIGRYFDGKMGLLIAIIEKHIEDIPVRNLPHPPQATAREELYKLLDVMYDKHCHKDQEFFKIVLSQALTDPKFMKRFRDLIPKTAHPEVRSRFEALQKAKKIRADVDLDLLLETLETFFHGVMLFEKTLLGYDDKKVMERLHFMLDTYSRSIEI